MTTAIRPIPQAPKGTEGLPKIGDRVIYMRAQEAVVTRPRADGTLDLTIYRDGAPLALASVPHDLESGWARPLEVPPLPPPPPTLDELLDRAEADGRRVPRPGTEVVFLYDADPRAPNSPYQDVRAMRGRVHRPTGVDRADIFVHINPIPPMEPDVPDEVYEQPERNVLYDPSGVHPNRFGYAGEFFYSGPVLVSEVRPRQRCRRPGCNRGADPGVHVEVAKVTNSGLWCPECAAVVAAFARGEEIIVPATAPA